MMVFSSLGSLLISPLAVLVGQQREMGRSLGGSVTSCFNASGAKCGDCGETCQYCSAKGFGANVPWFHLMDQFGCGENDPNGPVFDPVHGVIHHFYQSHVARPGGAGPSYGHFASRDFVFWANVPVALWNGVDYATNSSVDYDGKAIYTGSAAVVKGAAPDGVGKGVVQIYPGLCVASQWPSCKTGTVLAQAVPAAYADDALLEVWTKPSYNPVMNDTERDPSSPWKTPFGEWRMRTYNSKIYGAASDEALLKGQWYEVGTDASLRQGECPSLFPLPRLTAGFDNITTPLPTHVHKLSYSGKDWWQLGNYVDGPPGKVGVFEAADGWHDLFEPVLIDAGDFYASKDSDYPSLSGNKTRRVNWGWATVDPAATQSLPREITFNPFARTLEQAPLAELTQLRSKDNISLPNGNTTLQVPSGHFEVVASFDINSSDTIVVTIGACATCSLERQNNTLDVACGPFTDSLRLLPDLETSIDLRIFADSTFLEVYVQRGRLAMTLKCDQHLDDDALVPVSLNHNASFHTFTAYTLGSIWVKPDQVRNAPRLYY